MEVTVSTREQLENAIRRGMAEITIEGDLAPQFVKAQEIAAGKTTVAVAASDLLPTTDKDWGEIAALLKILVPHMDDWTTYYNQSVYGENGPVVLTHK